MAAVAAQASRVRPGSLMADSRPASTTRLRMSSSRIPDPKNRNLMSGLRASKASAVSMSKSGRFSSENLRMLPTTVSPSSIPNSRRSARQPASVAPSAHRPAAPGRGRRERRPAFLPWPGPRAVQGARHQRLGSRAPAPRHHGADRHGQKLAGLCARPRRLGPRAAERGSAARSAGNRRRPLRSGLPADRQPSPRVLLARHHRGSDPRRRHPGPRPSHRPPH